MPSAYNVWFKKAMARFSSVCFLLVCLLTLGYGLFHECGILEVASDFRYCYITVGLAESGHIISPGTEEYGYYNNNVYHSWVVMAENTTTQQLYACPAYLDLFIGDVILFYDVLEMLPDHHVKVTTRVPETYWGEGLKARDQESVEELMSLPCRVPETGMLLIVFMSTDSDVLTGFDFIYFAKSRDSDFPTTNVTVRVADFTQQMAVPEATSEFTVEVEDGERIWFQVIHMNLTSSASEVLNTEECKTNPNRVEISERNCSTDDCLLAILCRNPFNMTPVTLVTEGNYAHVRLFCNQEPGKECAVINYKVFNPLKDLGSCPPDADTDHTYAALGDQYNNLTHSFDVNSASDESNIWWLENINNNETQISITENSLDMSPDCVTERVEIYSGKCIRPENLVTYFCGGIQDTYKLTTSPFAAIRFTGRSYAAREQQKRFKLAINTGPPRHMPVRPHVIIITEDEQQSGMAITLLVVPLVLFIVLLFIPAAVQVVKAAKHRSSIAVAPAEDLTQFGPAIDPEVVGTPFAMYEGDERLMSQAGIDISQDLPPPYPGNTKVSPSFATPFDSSLMDAPGDMKQSLGLPQFPQQPSAVSLAQVPSPVHSFASFGEPQITMPDLDFGPAITTPELDFGQTMTTPDLDFGQTMTTPDLDFGPTITAHDLDFGPTMTKSDLDFEPTMTAHDLDFGPTMTAPDLDFGPRVISPTSALKTSPSLEIHTSSLPSPTVTETVSLQAESPQSSAQVSDVAVPKKKPSVAEMQDESEEFPADSPQPSAKVSDISVPKKEPSVSAIDDINQLPSLANEQLTETEPVQVAPVLEPLPSASVETPEAPLSTPEQPPVQVPADVVLAPTPVPVVEPPAPTITLEKKPSTVSPAEKPSVPSIVEAPHVHAHVPVEEPPIQGPVLEEKLSTIGPLKKPSVPVVVDVKPATQLEEQAPAIIPSTQAQVVEPTETTVEESPVTQKEVEPFAVSPPSQNQTEMSPAPVEEIQQQLPLFNRYLPPVTTSDQLPHEMQDVQSPDQPPNQIPGMAVQEGAIAHPSLDNVTGLPILPVDEATGKMKRKKSRIKGKGTAVGKGKKKGKKKKK